MANLGPVHDDVTINFLENLASLEADVAGPEDPDVASFGNFRYMSVVRKLAKRQHLQIWREPILSHKLEI